MPRFHCEFKNCHCLCYHSNKGMCLNCNHAKLWHSRRSLGPPRDSYLQFASPRKKHVSLFTFLIYTLLKYLFLDYQLFLLFLRTMLMFLLCIALVLRIYRHNLSILYTILNNSHIFHHTCMYWIVWVKVFDNWIRKHLV